MAYALVQQAFNSSVSGVTALSAIAGGESAAVASASQTVATPGVFTTVTQAFTAGIPVFLTGTAPGGFSLNVIYYIIAAGLTTTSCELSLTVGGAGIQCTASAACTINPAPILTAGNTLITATVQAAGSTPTLTDTLGNTFSAPVATPNLGTSLVFYLCQNTLGGPNVIIGHSNSTNLSAVFSAEYSGLVQSGGSIAFAGQGQNGPGAGTDSVTSGTFPVATVPALLWALSLDQTGTNVPVAGTNFIGRGSIWANYTGGVRAITEDKRILTGAVYAGTFAPSVSGHTGDLFNTIAVALLEIGGGNPIGGPTPRQIYIMP